MRRTMESVLNNQSGAALVIALVMIIVLTLIGLASTLTSTFEVRLSGTKRGSTNAFYAADSGVQVVMASISNFDLPGKYDLSDQYHYSEWRDPDSGEKNLNPTDANIIVHHNPLQTGSPRGLGMSATGNFGFEHYLIGSTGQDQLDLGLTKSTCTIEQKVVRLVPTLQGGN